MAGILEDDVWSAWLREIDAISAAAFKPVLNSIDGAN